MTGHPLGVVPGAGARSVVAHLVGTVGAAELMMMRSPVVFGEINFDPNGWYLTSKRRLRKRRTQAGGVA